MPSGQFSFGPFPGGATGRRQLRCADADREQLIEELRRHAGDGRLTLDELDERIELAYKAKTFSDLDVLVKDLPGSMPAPMPLRGAGLPVRAKPAKRGRPLRYRALNYLAIDIACVIVYLMMHGLNNWAWNDFWPAWVIGVTVIMFMFKVVGAIERRHKAQQA